jgi:hypothetical protein
LILFAVEDPSDDMEGVEGIVCFKLNIKFVRLMQKLGEHQWQEDDVDLSKK